MHFRISTIEKLGETCIRFGEAAVIEGRQPCLCRIFPPLFHLEELSAGQCSYGSVF